MILFSAFLLLFVCNAGAQINNWEDSLRRIENSLKLDDFDKIKFMTNLGHAVFYQNNSETGLYILNKTLGRAKNSKATAYIARIYATIGLHLYDKGEYKKGQNYVDSALALINLFSDQSIKGFVYYTDGFIKEGEKDKKGAVESFLKGIKVLENTDDFTYQSVMYGELSYIYGQWNDYKNQEKYARLNLETANRSNNINVFLTANEVLAGSFVDRYKADTTRKNYLDSALLYNHNSLNAYMENTNRIVHPGEKAKIAKHISDVYGMKSEKYDDSAVKYLNIAIEEAKKYKSNLILSESYVTLAKYELARGNTGKAELLAGMAAIELVNGPTVVNTTQMQVSEIFAHISEKKGDAAEALRYYKQYMKDYAGIYNQEQMAVGKRLEAQYQTEKKERELLAALYATDLKKKELIEARYDNAKKQQALVQAQYEVSLRNNELLALKYDTGMKQQALIASELKSVKKEQELINANQKVEDGKRLNKIYFASILATILGLMLLGYAYRQRAQANSKQRKLYQFEVDKIKQEHQISLLSAMLDGQEQERTRLARDMHDGLGGLLSGVKIQLSGLMPLSTDKKQYSIIEKALGHLDSAVDELRRIARSMMPEVLITYGLGEATKEYCNGLKKTGIPIDCQVYNYSNEMEPSRQIILYRIMQEAVNNAVKHAQASQIFVQLQQTDDMLYLTVEDNGKGFDTRKTNVLKSAGLANIQARVEMLNGKLYVQSGAEDGTSFSVECSVKQQNEI
ncbi:MAG: sensor histidine kinase [Chitinophagaceae bacterium]|nr:sensor histidine kinase [Chitinophagaceae bacterium]